MGGGSVLLIFFSFLCGVSVLFVFILCLVCPMLPVSLDYPFFIAPSVYLHILLWSLYYKILGWGCLYISFFNENTKAVVKMFFTFVSQWFVEGLWFSSTTFVFSRSNTIYDILSILNILESIQHSKELSLVLSSVTCCLPTVIQVLSVTRQHS